MPSPPWPSAAAGSTGRPSAGGEKCGCGAREGKLLHLAWQAHTDTTYALALSPDEHTLASGSNDGSVKLWDVERGALLWSGWHTQSIMRLAFSPDGSLLASGGVDATVRLWESEAGHPPGGIAASQFSHLAGLEPGWAPARQ